jgi:spermidine/putrescine-binding protein
MASAMPGLGRTGKALAAGAIGDRVSIATWPNYYNPENYAKFTEMTGAEVQISVFGSNEEMLAKLQAGGTGWDVFVPTNYTISTYVDLDLIQPLDLSRISNFEESAYIPRFIEPGSVNGAVYAVPKNWGTTGFVINRDKLTMPVDSWKAFWDITQAEASGRVMVHDYQLTTIGNALKYFGYSFNSVDPAELADAEKLLIDAKPHLFAIKVDSIVGGGSILSGGRIERSVLFHSVRVHARADVQQSVLFPGVDVGRGARLRRCIVDKGVRIPENDVIGEDPERDRERFTVSEGGVVVVSREHYAQLDEFDPPAGVGLAR